MSVTVYQDIKSRHHSLVDNLVSQSAPLRIAIVAGESSGDILGSDLIRAFQKRYPDAVFAGVAGPTMQAEGCHSYFPMDELSIIGIWAILKRLPRLLKLRKKLALQITEWGADLFIGIDAPEFNLGLEKKLKDSGIKTVHYVSPSVWAWREKRIFKIKQAIDYMLTLFPFEQEIYQQHKIPVSCVGHPLAEMLPLAPDTDVARSNLGLNSEASILAILPGSRGSEIKFLGQLFLETAVKLKAANPDLQIVIPLVNERRRKQFAQLIQESCPDLDLIIVEGNSREVMCAADAILLASGTATLEALLLKKPMVVAYKVSPLSYAIYIRMMKIQHFALPNLLAKTPVVKELIQGDATVETLTEEISKQLEQGLSEQQKVEYTEIHRSLQLGGGEKAVADLVGFFDISD